MYVQRANPMNRGPILWGHCMYKGPINPVGKRCMYKVPTLTCIRTEQDGYKRPIINGVQRTTRCTDDRVVHMGTLLCAYTTHRVSLCMGGYNVCTQDHAIVSHDMVDKSADDLSLLFLD